MLRADRAGQAGFMYLEVVIASALTISVLLGISSAVLAASHAAALANESVGLTDDAQNILADVRAIAAYGDATTSDRTSQLLPRLFGRSVSITLQRPGQSVELVTLSIAAIAHSSNQTVARATVSADGVTVSQQQALYFEAPSPGSTVNE